MYKNKLPKGSKIVKKNKVIDEETKKKLSVNTLCKRKK